MIDFTDVRRTKKETYYFFNAMFVPELTFLLESGGVTDYRILKYGEMQRTVGKENIPDVPIDMLNSRKMRATAVLISHFNVRLLRKKIKKLLFSKELRDWETAKSKEELKHIEEYYGIKIPK